MCVRVFINEPGVGMAVGRTLDVSFDGDPTMVFHPRGRRVETGSGLSWVAAHDSLVITDFGDLVLDGFNDRGLAAHALMFTDAEFEPADDRPELPTGLWLQYLLDCAGSVDEALDLLTGVRVVPQEALGLPVGVHLVVEDLSGATAVIEPIAGRMVTVRGDDIPVLANAPAFDEQQRNLARYRPFGGELPPPGDITSLDRFVRASYFLHYLPRPATVEEAVGGVFQVLSTVAKPPGAPYPSGEVYPTRWLSAIDLEAGTYYFWSRRSPVMLWVSLTDVVRGGVDHPVTASVSLFDPALSADFAGAFLAAAATSA